MKVAYIYDEQDTHGPHVLLCEACIKANGQQVARQELEEFDGRQCACCGATDDNRGHDAFLQSLGI